MTNYNQLQIMFNFFFLRNMDVIFFFTNVMRSFDLLFGEENTNQLFY